MSSIELPDLNNEITLAEYEFPDNNIPNEWPVA